MKLTQVTKLLFVFVILLSSQNVAKATHAMGADLTYSCIGPNQYQIQLSFYRDCNGIDPSGSYSVSINSPSCGVNTSLTVSLASGYPIDITPLCPSEPSACGGPGTYGVEQYNYTGVISLPAGCNDWELSWTECCRNNAITTLNSPGNQDFYVEALLDGTVSPCNNSPVFNNIPTPFTCVGDLVNYNHGVSDPDGDDLVFSLVDCETSDDNSVNYAGGFAGTSPLTATGLTIDPVTGAISFTPTAVQVGVLCILVEEFRNGVKIGEVVRDMQFTVINCSNQAPTASGVDSPCDPNGPAGAYVLNNCAGETFCFDVLTCDDDGDNVNITWNQGVNNGQLNVVGNNTPTATAQFCWTPSDDDIGINFFTITVQDDACPIIGTNTFTYTIEITGNPNDPISTSPDQQICLGESTNISVNSTATNIIDYTWDPIDGLADPNAASTSASPTETTTYVVTATYDDGCIAQDFVTVTVAEQPNLSVFPNNATICTGGSINFSATTDYPLADITSVQWFEDPSGANTLVGTGYNVVANPANSTDYEIIVTTIDGCSNSVFTTVTIDDAPPLESCVNLYVTTTALATGAGTQNDPTSLDNALSLAACNDAVIKMATGTYNIDDAIQLRSQVTLEGGFDPTNNWTKTSLAGATTINRTTANVEDATGSAPRLVALYGNSLSYFRLQDLTITTNDAPDNAPNTSISTYGIHLTSCSDYDIVRCQILPGMGGMGQDGSNGSQGAVGANGLDGVNNNGGAGGGNGGNGGNGGTSNGAAGQAGTSGGGANGGSGSSGNTGGSFFNCPFGDPDSGNDGGNGATGADGSSGSAPTVVGSFYTPGGNGSDGAVGATGGGGGGSGGEAGGLGQDGGGGGGGGGGGAGGNGGTGGTAGGNSVGIFIHNNGTNGNIEDCNIVGQGGQGGSGGQGGQGGNGGQGGDGTTDGTFGLSICDNDSSGGNGGQGGQGGNGGQGANGVSLGIFVNGTNNLNNSDESFNLAAQPTITAENINCTLTDTDFTGTSTNWNFSSNANPVSPSGNSVTTQFNNIDRYNVLNGSDVYTDFHLVSFGGETKPEINTDATQIGVDTFQLCSGDIANFSTDIGATSYIWNFDGAIPNPATTEQIVSGNTFSTSGFFTIELFVNTDCCGDSPIDTIYLYVDPVPVVNPVTNPTVCKGDAAIISLTGNDIDSIVWNPNINLTYINTNDVSVQPNVSTTYTAEVYKTTNTSMTFSCPEIVTIDVTVLDELNLNLNANDVNCVADGSVVANITNGSGNFSFNWSHDNTLNANTASNLVAGNYAVTVTDNVTGCTEIDSVFVVDGISVPFVFIENSTNISCFGEADGTVQVNTANGTPGFNYAWSFGGLTGSSLTNLGPGTYTVTVTDGNGCTSSNQVDIYEPPLLQIDPIDTTQATCDGLNDGFFEINAYGGTGPFTYAWSNGGSSDTIQNLASGFYTVTVTDANGCTATLEQEIIALFSLTPSLAITQGLDCFGDSDAIIEATPAGGTGPYTYQWADTNGPLASTNNPLTSLAANTYYMTVTDVNGCLSIDSIEITQPDEIILDAITPMDASCNSGTDGSITVTASGGTVAADYTYNWNTVPVQNTATASNLMAGTYTVTISDDNACTITASATVGEPLAVTPSIAVDQEVSCSGGNDGMLTASATGGTIAVDYVYSWSTIPAQNTATANGLSAGTYTVTITDDNMCTATSEITINEPSAVVASTVEDNGVSCNGGADGQATASGSGGTVTTDYSYTWSTMPAQTTATATGLASGTYTVTISDDNMCTATSEVIINEPTSVTASTVTDQDVSCDGGADGQATASGMGGTIALDYTYAWSTMPVQNTATVNGLSAGTYTVTITDDNNCTATAEAIISEPTAVIASTIIDQNVSCNSLSDGQATASGMGGTIALDYNYAWNTIPVQNTATATGLSAGTYTVTITDDNNCTATAEAIITQPDPLGSLTSLTPISCNGGDDGTATASGSGGTTASGDYSYAWSTVPPQNTATITNLTSGSYTVTITDDNACTVTGSVTLVDPPLVTSSAIVDQDVTCNGGADGQATASGAGGIVLTDYNYIWSTTPPQNTATATGLPAGTYTVTVSDSNACESTSEVTIVEPASIIASTVIDQNASCNGASDGQATASGMGGNIALDYNYVWSTVPPQNTATATGLAAGTYTVTISDDNACSVTAEATIQEPAGITPLTVVDQEVSCNGGNDGQATASASGGSVALDYTYTWSTVPVQSTATVTGLSVGTYTVTISDDNACSVTSEVIINEPSILGVNITNTLISCNGGNNGTATATGNGGTSASGDYLYAWSTIPQQNTATATNLVAGTYTVTVTDDNACTVTGSVTLTDPTLVTATAGLDQNVSCNGGNDGQATATGAGGTIALDYSYAWSTTPIQNTATATGLPAGTYTVTITDDNACSATDEVTITEPIAITASVITDQNVSCNGGNDGQATATGANGTIALDYSYAWSTTPIQNTATASGLSAGTYTVTITDDNACSATDEVTIMEPAAITSNVILDQNVSCNGGNDGQATAVGSGGTVALDYTYAWSTVPVQNTATATGLTAGNYTVTISDDNACSVTGTVTIVEPSAVGSSLAIANNVSCTGGNDGSIIATGSGGTIALDYNYTWSTVPVQNTATATGLVAGTYTVTITDDNGCSSTESTTLNDPNPIVPMVSADQNVSCTGSNDGQATATAMGGTVVGGYTFAWSTTPVQNTATATGLVAGTYTVTISDDNACSATDVVTITEPAPLTLSTSQNNVGCAGDNDGSATVTATDGTAGYTYLWNTVPPQLTATANGLIAGNYTVTVTDTNLCTATTSVTITEPISISVNAVQVQQQSNCAAPDGIAQASASNGTAPYTFTWNTTPPQIGDTANGLTLGNYIITVSDANNCTATATVFVDATFTIEPNEVVTNVSCNGGSDGNIELNPVGVAPFSFNWSSGSGNPNANLTANDYTVTITDGNGCSRVETYTVTEPSDLVITTLDVSDASCDNSSDGSITVNISGGTGAYTYTWDGNATGQDDTATNLPPGTYNLTVTDANNCTETANFTISAPAPVVINLNTSTDANCSACDGTALVTASGGTLPYTYLWSNGNNNPNPDNLCAGINTVSVTDGNGCTTSFDVNIGSISTLVVTGVDPLDASCNNGCDGEATVNVTGGQMPYSYQWDAFTGNQTTETATGLCAGTYDVTVTDVDGCVAAGSVTISEPDPLTLFLSSMDVVCFGEFNGSIHVDSAMGGTAPYSYSADGLSFIPDTAFTNVPSGDFTIYIQDANGCIDSSQIFVNQPPELLLTSYPIDTLINLGESVELAAIPNQPNVVLSWSPSDSLSCVDCPNPIVSPTQTIQYTVVATDTVNLCQTSATYLVRINKDREVFVPNAFTPNNDGFNDYVTVYAGINVRNVRTFKVFDRWGEMVFERNDFQPNEPSTGWDGYFKGKKMNPAVYIYFTEVEFIDGQVKIFKGDVTLVR